MANLDGDNFNRYEWQKSVRDALLELNPIVLKQKVADAETALFERLQTLAKADGTTEERQALEDAANSLRVLKRETLKFPDWRPD